MKKYTLSFLLTSLSLCAMAQQEIYKWRVGVQAGTLFSVSDISPNANFNFKNLGYGITAERFFNKAWSARVLAGAGRCEANDRDYTQSDNFARSLNAQTRITDVSVMGAYYFDNERNMTEISKVAPYFSAGLGLTSYSIFGDLYRDNNQRYYYYDSKIYDKAQGTAGAKEIKQDGIFETNLTELQTEGKKYSNLTWHIPVAMGLKFRINDRLNLNVEAIYKLTGSDFLDDVSGKYLATKDYANSVQAYAANPSGIVRENRGTASGNDNYGGLMLSVQYNFGYKAPEMDVPIFYTSAASPQSNGDATIGGSGASQPISTRNRTPNYEVKKQLTAYFKTKDTVSAAVADIERMRLEVAYLNKELGKMDTTYDNQSFLQSKNTRLVEIRTRANEYRKFGAGKPDENDRIRSLANDLNQERKDITVALTILGMSGSDKGRSLESIHKKDGDTDRFIAQQETKLNEMRAANGTAKINKEPEVAAVETPKKAIEAVVEPIEEPPVQTVIETPTVVREVKVVEAPVIVKPIEVVKATAEPNLLEKEATRVKALEEQVAALQRKLQEKENTKPAEPQVIYKESTQTSTALLQKDKEIEELRKRLAIIEAQKAADEAAAVAETAASPLETAKPNTPAPKVNPKTTAATDRQVAQLKEAVAAKQAEKAVAVKQAQTQTNNSIWFVPNDGKVTGAQLQRLNTVVQFMKANTTAKVELKPFLEPELKDPDIAYIRADAIKNYLIGKGIEADRVLVALAGRGSVAMGKKRVAGRRVDIRFIATAQ